MRTDVAVLALGIAGLAAAKPKPVLTEQYSLKLNGKTYTGDDIKIGAQACTGRLEVRGINNGFDIDCATMNLYDYYLTGAPAADRLVTSKTYVFASRELDLTPAQRGTPSIRDIRLRDGQANIIFAAAGGNKVKYQLKDKTQGGMFQLETEFGFNVTHTNTLADGVFYFLNPNMNNAVRIGNGIPASADHEVFVAKDSPQAANRLYQDGSKSSWNVWSGGRMGSVFGEDALEEAPAAVTCTSDCQAQNRIRGSLPVTQMPDFIVPIGTGED